MESHSEAPKLHRFFIALVPPEPIQAYARTVQQDFWERYRSRKALNSPPHITLQPPFNWPETNIEPLLTSLKEFSQAWAEVAISLNGFAAFPPRVIYLDVVKSPELMALQTALMTFLETHLKIVDPHSRHRPFKPHLTVAFRDLKPAAFRKAWPEFQDQSVELAFIAQALTLLRHNGQRWEIYRQFDFGANHPKPPSV
jgi:2'-5' RNA ligase